MARCLAGENDAADAQAAPPSRCFRSRACPLVAPPVFAAGAARTVIPFAISEPEHMIVALEINDRTRTTGVVDTAASFATVDSMVVASSGVVRAHS